MDSVEYYNNIHTDYSSQSSKRMLYLNAIDELIVEQCYKSINSYLDVGCGDGRRTRKIAKLLGADKTVGIDTSKNMLPSEKIDNIEFRCSQVSDLNQTEKYDLVTILWNVLGHIPSFAEREKLLRDCSLHLTKKGKIILDVNNRHNVAAYGKKNAFRNIVRSAITDNSGWNELKYGNSKHMVYVHDLQELKTLVKASGLKISKIEFVHYDTGALQSVPFFKSFFGQIFIVLEQQND